MTNPIIPRHVAYPKTFVAKEVRKRIDGSWKIIKDPAELTLNEQLRAFVDATGANVTFTSSPNITSLVEEADDRAYYVSVTIMYVLPEEGTQDNEPGRTDVG